MSRLSPLPLALLLLGALVVVVPACGKRGPPMPPLRPVPDRPTDVSVVRRADDVTIRFSTPTHNADKSEPVVFDRIEVYAMTVPPGGLMPTLKRLLAPANRLGEFGHPAAPAKGSGTDAAGDAPDAPPVAVPLVFSEKVAIAPPSKLIPPPAAFAEGVAPAGSLPPMFAAPGALPAAAAAAPLRLRIATRYYMLVPYAKNRRMGNVSDFLIVPLGPVPVTPRDTVMKYDEQTLTLSWVAGAPGQTFRVYDASPAPTTAATVAAAAAPKPLTPAPLTVTEFKQPVAFGRPVCWSVRGVLTAGPVSFESAPTPAVCVAPVDTFPPPTPSGLTAFVADGSIALTWDGVTAADLAGYIVLRGEGTSDRLQPLTAAPVQGTSFTDTTTRAGVKYVYAVIAVDNATPANRSKESSRVEETGR